MKTGNESSSLDPLGDGTGHALSRRNFVCMSCGCVAAASAAAPRVGAAWGDPVEIGSLSSYPRDEISEKYLENGFFVIRHNARLYACTSTCPHEQNSLYVNTQNPQEILCSGHQTAFDPDGKPFPGGRTQEGLVRFGIAVNDKGIVCVDPSKRFSQDQWEEAGSFVTVKGKP
jgi:nitrite reductase/ring-hydroxylating ferredoxin subunit